MCGIFGIALREADIIPCDSFQETTQKLFQYSQSRGKDAAGIAIFKDNKVTIKKSREKASVFIKSREFKELFNIGSKKTDNIHPSCVIGHTRLVTDGSSIHQDNNQPLEEHSFYCIHNGIIVNDDMLWDKYSFLEKKHTIDTEIFLKIFSHLCRNHSYAQSLSLTYSEIEGTVSTALIDSINKNLILATNNGSLYYMADSNQEIFIFASEYSMLKRIKSCGILKSFENKLEIFHVGAHQAIIMNLDTLHRENFLLDNSNKCQSRIFSQKNGNAFKNAVENTEFNDNENLWLYPQNYHLKRCSICILTETMPFISFDEKGVCNYCHSYKNIKLQGKDKFLQILDEHRQNNGNPDCIVAFSGGRDSSYGLHLIKKEFGMNPIAYSYDWGIITDIGRRNQARVCGKLGIEHILVSADIKKKRDNIRKNINAWIHQPVLGMIPLLMAGDKQFFYYANKIKKDTGIQLLIFCQNFLEHVGFKAGFSGINNIGYVKDLSQGRRHITISNFNKIKILYYYMKQYLLNPRYLNNSIIDTFWAYLCYYFIRQDHVYLYKYVPWNEKIINDILINEYNWEIAKDTSTTWRIGDGTAAFYNYVYRTICGFSENDCFRSNQIREHHIDRSDALKLIEVENYPRKESILEYLDVIRVNHKEVLKTINALPRMY